jgi:hypothetical protein
LFHEFHDQFVIDLKSLLPHLKRDPPITITAFMLAADISDHFSLFELLLGLKEAFQVIVIAASGKARYGQKQR